MTFAELQNAVLRKRFSETDRGAAREWINYAAKQLWSLEPWEFKKRNATVGTVTGTAALQSLPVDLGKPLQLYNERGYALFYLHPDQWNEVYYADNTQGHPSHWTYIGGEILLGPTPVDTNANWRLYYERAYGHLNHSGVFVTGDMVNDDDRPAFPDGTHYILVHWARAIGKAENNDPTAAIENSLKDEGLISMRRDHVVDTYQTDQWGAFDPLYDIDPFFA